MDIVEEIRSKIPIEDLVSHYVELKPSGRTLKARCPFHSEKTPSFHVFPDKGTWRCFGACSIGGDIFSFIEKLQGVDFKEALRILADQAGLELPDKKPTREIDILYEINGAAAKYYVGNLKGAPLEYMYERSFSAETLSRFQIGLSTEKDGLYKHLLKQYKADDILRSGLAIKENERITRDFFASRIIFPIKNESGQIIGFAGRTLDAKSKVKYLNTPQTPIFSKKSILWGIDAAKQAIRKEKALVLVEGYTDVMMAHQYGFCNTVGLCGSSITPEHLAIIKKYATTLLLALDSDAAGVQATLRSIKLARTVFTGHAASPDFIEGDPVPHRDLKIIELPSGQDPDVCINASPAEWQLRITTAKPAMDYLFDAILARLDLKREVGRASAAEQLMPIINELNDPVERELYAEKLGKIIGVDIEVLQTTNYKRSKKSRRIEASAKSDNAEEYCLALILKYGHTNETAGLAEMLTPDLFANLENRELFTLWRQQRLPEEIHLQRHYDYLLSTLEKNAFSTVAGPGTLSDCIKFLDKEWKHRQNDMLVGLLRDVTDPDEQVKYLEQLDELRGVKNANTGGSKTVDQSSDGETETI